MIEWYGLDIVSFKYTYSICWGNKLLDWVPTVDTVGLMCVRMHTNIKPCSWSLSQYTRRLPSWNDDCWECMYSPDSSVKYALGSKSYWLHSVTERFHCSCWVWLIYLKRWDWEERPPRSEPREMILDFASSVTNQFRDCIISLDTTWFWHLGKTWDRAVN